jgi:hypothetical protein
MGKVQMEGISWADLDDDEQRTLAMLMEGVSTDLCDPVALLTLKRIGLITGSQLTPAAEQLLAETVRSALPPEQYDLVCRNNYRTLHQAARLVSHGA